MDSAEDAVPFIEVDDMIFLPELSVETLLTNIQLRYEKGKIYTYTGAILVSVNPYRSLPVYTLDIALSYFNTSLGQQPPHIFAIAEQVCIFFYINFFILIFLLICFFN